MRGSEDCSNQGVGPGRRVVAVAGKLTSQVTQLTVLGTLDVTGDSPGEPHNIETIVTQNPLPNSTHGFQIQVIEPSKTTLAELAKRNESGGDAEGLHQYAQDLLAAIRDLCTSPSANYPPFCSFILRSCLPKIAHCLASDKYLFPRL
ncbi:hypothetical protein BS47DRAFT_596230 [Hydnum rufescens UP504]|uniref:Uncharacterized protein n=1 Tax=Hydnum rufescens UP504 TaxID=1448309 RepID=A0A9P6AFP1_9AGAM|nr:hypothetical protein BS47DRAFT_596230 [Hydnum rufescens UP504]